MEGKTTLAWVALPKGKEPSVASAETCEANEYKWAKNLFTTEASALYFLDV